MIRNKEIKMLPACKRCGYVPGFEHIEVHTMYGPWEGWIIECGCNDRIVRGNAEAAIKAWSERNEGRNKNNDNRRRSA